MRILYHKRSRADTELEEEARAEYADKELLLKTSDFVSIHVPLTRETRHLIGYRELCMMKPTAYIINTARGEIIYEEALVRALKEKRIAGAALDVFEHEPDIHPALTRMDNVIMLPHIGSATIETRTKMGLMAAKNLIAFFRGEMPPNCINPEVLGL
jgi:glyoxylate reductase